MRPAVKRRLLTLAAAALLCAVLEVSCQSGPSQTRRPTPAGLTARGDSQLDALVAAQHDPERFRQELDHISSTGEFESVVVLTHAMFELPWVADLKPESRYDTRMPKLAVKHRLDQLIAAQEHDRLSAAYFRALKTGADIEAAKQELLSWTAAHRSKLAWDGEHFELRE
jgi:hypothetical protein